MKKGYFSKKVVIKETATPIDNIEKFAWYDEDYETIQEWHEYTAEELAEIEKAEAQEEKRKQIEALPDAVSGIHDSLADIADRTSKNELSMEDVQDALVELADLIASTISE